MTLNQQQTEELKVLLLDYLEASLRWWMPLHKDLPSSVLRTIDKSVDGNEITNHIQTKYVQKCEASLLNASIGILDEYYEIDLTDKSSYESVIDEFGDLLFYISMLTNELYGKEGNNHIIAAFNSVLEDNTDYYGINVNKHIQFLLSFSKKFVFHKKEYDIYSMQFMNNISNVIASVFFDNLLFIISTYTLLPQHIQVLSDNYWYNVTDKNNKYEFLNVILKDIVNHNIAKLEKRQGIKRVNEIAAA